jgi:hypothetical protein
MPGKELVKVVTMPMARAPNKVNPMPLEMYSERSPEKIIAAKDISTRITKIPATRPAVRLGNN